MKSKVKTIEKGLSNTMAHFYKQLCLLKEVCNTKMNGRASETKILLASCCTTGTALLELGSKPEYFYIETMMLSRSFLEKIINFCYLQICSEKEFENFLLHPFYRQYHNLNRNKKAGKSDIGIKFSGIKDFEKQPSVKKALEKFSKANSKMNWSKKTVDQKVNIIEQKTKKDVFFFLINTLTIYSSASESLHGSLYGCSYHTGAFDPSIDHRDLTKVHINILKNLILLYVQLGGLTHFTIELINSKDKSFKKILEKSSKDVKNPLIFLKKVFEK